jgi:hypothetical protein
MNKRTLLRRIVSCESPLFLTALFPEYIISEDISSQSPIIYTGAVTPKRYNALFARHADFIACPAHGGDVSLSREDCAAALDVSFRSAWSDLSVLEFVNILRIIATIGESPSATKQPSVYPIFEVIAKRSLSGAKGIPDILFSSTPETVLSALLTFCGKALHFSGASPAKIGLRHHKYGIEYTTLLSLSKSRSADIHAALNRVAGMEGFPADLQVYALVLTALQVI